MRFGIFFVQAAGQFFLVTGAAKANTVCRRVCLFILSRLFLLGIACNSLEIGDFYYISVI